MDGKIYHTNNTQKQVMVAISISYKVTMKTKHISRQSTGFVIVKETRTERYYMPVMTQLPTHKAKTDRFKENINYIKIGKDCNTL